MKPDIKKAKLLLAEADTARKENRFNDAKRCLVSALAITRLAHNPSLRARTLNNLARIEWDLKNKIPAIAGYMRLSKLCDKIGDRLGVAHAFRHLGDIHREVGNFRRAEECYLKALSIYHSENEHQLSLANTLRGYALLMMKQNKREQSLSFWNDAKSIYELQHINEGVKECDEWIKKLG